LDKSRGVGEESVFKMKAESYTATGGRKKETRLRKRRLSVNVGHPLGIDPEENRGNLRRDRRDQKRLGSLNWFIKFFGSAEGEKEIGQKEAEGTDGIGMLRISP